MPPAAISYHSRKGSQLAWICSFTRSPSFLFWMPSHRTPSWHRYKASELKVPINWITEYFSPVLTVSQPLFASRWRTRATATTQPSRWSLGCSARRRVDFVSNRLKILQNKNRFHFKYHFYHVVVPENASRWWFQKISWYLKRYATFREHTETSASCANMHHEWAEVVLQNIGRTEVGSGESPSLMQEFLDRQQLTNTIVTQVKRQTR